MICLTNAVANYFKSCQELENPSQAFLHVSPQERISVCTANLRNPGVNAFLPNAPREGIKMPEKKKN